MQSFKSNPLSVHSAWAAPMRRFGLLLSLASLMPGCQGQADEDEEESSEQDSAEGSNDKEPEKSDEGTEDKKSDEGSGDKEPEGSGDKDPEGSGDKEPEGSGDKEPEGSGDSKRDCEKIEWGKKGIEEGRIVARGDAKGLADSNNDFKPENDEADAGMCELHLTKYRCAMIIYGAG